MAKDCQQQGKGLFCLWYSLWPMIFACTGESLATFINDNKQLVKSFEYTFLEPWLKTGLATSNNAKWRSRRRLITPSFHDTQLLHNFMLIFNEQSFVFAQRLEECVDIGHEAKAYDLYPYISTCTLDIIIIEDRLATFHTEDTMNDDGKKTNRRLVFLDSLLTEMHSEQLTLDDIQEEVDTFMFAVQFLTFLFIPYVNHESN
ncbi:unnamed protein product [Rotaria sp. Silwood1]|nr:unnamed protein product [Rotaria sp. Silwood1]